MSRRRHRSLLYCCGNVEVSVTPVAPDRLPTILRKPVLILVIAASLSGCADAAFGPVDHECHGSPFRSHGSGCSGHGGVTHPIIVAFSASDRPTNDAVYPTSQLACCRLSLK